MRAAALRRPNSRLDPIDDYDADVARPRGTVATLAAAGRSFVRRVLGAGFLAVAIFVALALFGFDPADPSFNQATSAPVQNPAGPTGAWLADLLLQFFGYAALVPVLVLAGWGLRLVLDRRLAWPWLPVLSLPPALLAASAFFASRAIPEEGWPFRVGLGGFVGDFQFLRLEPEVGHAAYVWGSGLLALVLLVMAIGVRWRRSMWFAGRVASGSRLVGRGVGRAATVAGSGGGRAIAAGLHGLRNRGGANDNEEHAPPDEDRPGLLARLQGLSDPPRRAADEDEAPAASPPLRGRRPVARSPPPTTRASMPRSRRPSRRAPSRAARSG
ncbi:MAG: DNA translocase FtsK 4TM domain-containing protein [Geminicoccaceae bacterium]